MSRDPVHAIVADVGGTNTRVARADGPQLVPGSVQRFRNADHSGLDSVLRAYVGQAKGAPACEGACVAVAGPVRGGRATLTNLDWSIDPALVSGATGAGTVAVINDLQAQGYAIGFLDPASAVPVVGAAPDDPDATKLVVGVGTGFNAAPVYDTPGGRFVPPSESGHASLPVRTEADWRLADFVAREHGFADVEDALSGRGIEHVYAWLGEEAGTPGTLGAGDIMLRCRDGADPRATDTVRTFVRILGNVTGDLALTFLPSGGIYLVGGVSRAFLPHLRPMGFAEAFSDKGRFGRFMKGFPVWVVDDDYAALVGCASHLAGLMQRA